MDRKVKLIWVYSGPEAEDLAKSKALEVEGFGVQEKLELSISGTEYISHISWLAYLIVFENDVLKVRKALKPLRTEFFEN